MKDKIKIYYDMQEDKIPQPQTRSCFAHFIGCELLGTIWLTDRDNLERAGPSKVLVFNNGKGLLISDKGHYRVISMSDMAPMLLRTEKEFDITYDNRKKIDEIFDLTEYENRNRIPNDPIVKIPSAPF